MADIVIRAKISYSLFAILYSMPTIKKLNKKIIALHKTISEFPKYTLNIITQQLHDFFGMEAFSLKNTFLRCIDEQLCNILKILEGLAEFTID